MCNCSKQNNKRTVYDNVFPFLRQCLLVGIDSRLLAWTGQPVNGNHALHADACVYWNPLMNPLMTPLRNPGSLWSLQCLLHCKSMLHQFACLLSIACCYAANPLDSSFLFSPFLHTFFPHFSLIFYTGERIDDCACHNPFVEAHSGGILLLRQQWGSGPSFHGAWNRPAKNPPTSESGDSIFAQLILAAVVTQRLTLQIHFTTNLL